MIGLLERDGQIVRPITLEVLPLLSKRFPWALLLMDTWDETNGYGNVPSGVASLRLLFASPPCCQLGALLQPVGEHVALSDYCASQSVQRPEASRDGGEETARAE